MLTRAFGVKGLGLRVRVRGLKTEIQGLGAGCLGPCTLQAGSCPGLRASLFRFALLVVQGDPGGVKTVVFLAFRIYSDS